MSKMILFSMGLLYCGFSFASDSATCTVYLNDVQVSESIVFHKDYDFNLTGEFEYRTYKKDEFYNLNFSFVSNSQSQNTKLVVNLAGTSNQYQAVMMSQETSITAQLIDHEYNNLKVSCKIN